MMESGRRRSALISRGPLWVRKIDDTAPPFGGDLANAMISKGVIGGRCRARTYDPLIKSQLLYQLS